MISPHCTKSLKHLKQSALSKLHHATLYQNFDMQYFAIT
jgi:hypothetical protein